jgi:hypothetical protein
LYNTVAYLPKARTVEPGKQPLLGNGCVTRKSGITVGSGVFCAVRVEAIKRGPAAVTIQSLETAVRRIMCLCEMVDNLRGREPGSTVGSRYQAAQ